jgi:LuxR family glucitol operon transcriptional activator
MSFSATRLTCFALLAAMEQDMRDAIELHLGDKSLVELLPQERAEKAQARRLKDGLKIANNLGGLLPYLDFGESYELLTGRGRELPEDFGESIRLLGPRVARVIAIRNRVAHTRPMEIDDPATLLDVASEFTRTSSAWSSVKETVEKLQADPSYVLGLTVNLPADPDRAPQHNLPVPDFDETGFFGRQEELRRIKKAIKGAYPVVSILGDGGIGKTSIALKVAYELLEDPTQLFDAFVWVTAKATILTVTEIKRINGAIESSLGLFAKAAEELLGDSASDPIGEVLAYMENFRILLILDNLETVLDQRLRDFLLDLPLGSKVMITSRIGLGIENPVQLRPLSDDDSARLLRALARIRNVAALTSMPQSAVERLAGQMAGHPTYIRWFVAGVQAGQRPEDLIASNELLLDFCMSNVYEYLSDSARAAVRSMQALPGEHNQAELAFLNDFAAAATQAVLLELLTTNFVQMSSQSSGETLDTVYQLSDFARQYLDKHHTVDHEERAWLLQRSQELTDLGFQLSVEGTSSPYAAETVLVRGMGDVHAARLLRDAMLHAAFDPATGLTLCKEAQILAPSYYETWRVEGHLHAVDLDHASALAAFERALELAPDSPILSFHFGSYLLNEAGDPRRGLEKLHWGARLDPESPQLLGQIAWAHYCLRDMPSAIASVDHLLTLRNSTATERKAACIVTLRAANAALDETAALRDRASVLEVAEMAIGAIERVNPNQLRNESLDRMILLQSQIQRLASGAIGYVQLKASGCEDRLQTLQEKADPGSDARRVGVIKNVVHEKRFAFLRFDGRDCFFHYKDLVDRLDWDQMVEGTNCAFVPRLNTPRGPKAESVRVLA